MKFSTPVRSAGVFVFVADAVHSTDLNEVFSVLWRGGMITKSPDNDVDTREQIRREGGRARRGSPPLAQQPWPDQLARKAMSSAHHHPRKRDRNRDWKTVPRGSLATD